MSNNVLLIGGAGYIGQHIAWALHDIGITVVVLDNLTTGSKDNLPPCELIIDDISTVDIDRLIEWRGGIDAIIHLAALTSVPESLEKPDLYFKINTIGTWHALELTRQLNADMFIFSSTAAVYGKPIELPVTESHPVHPFNTYGMSKLAAEMLIKDYCNIYGIRGIALRYFNVIGCDPELRTGDTRGITDNVVHQLMRCIDDPKAIFSIYGNDYDTPDGSPVRDFIHVSDIASAHIYAMKNIKNINDKFSVINVGYGKGYSIKELVNTLVEVAPKHFYPTIENSNRRIGDIEKIWADNKALLQLGWKPKFDDLTTMLKHSLDWHLFNDNKN